MGDEIANVSFTAFQPELLRFGDVSKYESSGSLYIPVTYPDPSDGVYRSLQLQTPTMLMPMGVSKFPKKDKPDEFDKTILLNFRNPTPAVTAFQGQMEKVDELVLNAVYERRAKFLNNPSISKELLEQFQTKIVKPGAKEEYGHSMRIKWPYKGDPLFCDASQAPVQEDHCSKGSTGRAMIRMRPVWTVQKGFGVKWEIVKVRVSTRPDLSNKLAFDDDVPPPTVLAAPEGDDMSDE